MLHKIPQNSPKTFFFFLKKRYEDKNWQYVSSGDRRFYTEVNFKIWFNFKRQMFVKTIQHLLRRQICFWKIQNNKFKSKVKEGLKPAGQTLMTNDAEGAPAIPDGCYDTGNGRFFLQIWFFVWQSFNFKLKTF